MAYIKVVEQNEAAGELKEVISKEVSFLTFLKYTACCPKR